MDPVVDFMAMTECGSEDIAIHYLSLSDFDVSRAVTMYNDEVAAERRRTAAAHGVEVDVDAPLAYGGTSPPSSATMASSPSPGPPATSNASDLSGRRRGANGGAEEGHVQPVEEVVEGLFEALPSAMVSRNPFENSDNATLREMFTTPDYVRQAANSLPAICRAAAEKDKWVLLALRDGNFQSVTLPRDVWRLETMMALQPSLECFEADLRTSEGRQLAQGLRADTRHLPVFFLLDPITSCCEKVIQVRIGPIGELDGARVVDDILQFIAAHDSPHAYLAQRQQVPSTGPTTIIDDGEDEDVQEDHRARINEGSAGQDKLTRVPQTTSQTGAGAATHVPVTSSTVGSHETHHQTGNRANAVAQESNISEDEDEEGGSNAPAWLSATQPVSLDAWRVSEPGAPCYKLRCRLPRETLELLLQPSTPLRALHDFFADHIARSEPTRYATRPAVVLQSGFPPKAVVASGTAPTLADCANLHSNDVLIVSVAK